MGVPAALHLSTLLVVTASILLACARPSAATTTRHYKFEIRLKNVTRLCKTKSIVTVNGQFPGPTIVAREGDRVVVNVVNHVQNNITLHWHGVRQLLSGWADGPVYITQCPIQAGRAYVYNFIVTGQVGTLWWHAHASWLRATVYGPLVILPKPGVSYPFPKPYKEIPILLGEWFNADTEAVIAQALQTGAGPNVSDAYTINGLPGLLYNCSNEDTFELKVKPGKTYLLRLINAALNNELFFTVANHTVTVVEADANYVVPFTADVVLLSPGQTTNVLLHALPSAPNGTSFLFVARPYATGQGTFDNTTTAGILRYHDSESVNPGEAAAERVPLVQPASFPSVNGSTDYATNFTAKFRSLAPPNFPREVDRRFFFTVGLGTDPCPENQTCLGPNGTKFAAAINNVSFALPSTTSLLQARYQGRPSGVYTADFPGYPPFPFNYTGEPPNNTLVSHGTRVVVVPFNTSVELVLQDTGILGAERHPLHLHGHNFFVVGQGFGNFDRLNDPPSFNLVDPVQRNTFGVPLGGWLAVRFTADNPGAWLMHCHVDVHLSWGMRMAWEVNDGAHPNQKLPPPPPDLPEC